MKNVMLSCAVMDTSWLNFEMISDENLNVRTSEEKSF